MTRAVVGGINPIDNEFYPLAVNSQGIAQIDTSGIPQPMEWQTTSFTPTYKSTDSDPNIGAVTYASNSGTIYRLGDVAFWTLTLRTSALTITNPRGGLVVTGFPFTWNFSAANPLRGNLDVSTFNSFDITANAVSGYTLNSSNDFVLTKVVPGEVNQQQVAVTDMHEHSEAPTSNILFAFGWGVITSDSSPSVVKNVLDL